MKKSRLSRLFLLSVISLCLLVPGVLVAAGRTDTVHYDMDSGLSSSLVGGGIQDSNGLMWFATWNGLNCYDGYDFHWVKIQPGDKATIDTNHIRDILLSDEGNIICRTDEDIFEYDLTSYCFREIPDDTKRLLRDKVGKNWKGFRDIQGNFWTADHLGLYKTVAVHHPASILPGTEGKRPRSFLIDRDGNLMVGMREDCSIRVYSQDGTPLSEIKIDTAPYCIFQSSLGDVWVGGKPGALIKLGVGRVSDDEIYDIAEDSHGRLWIATFDNGVKCCPNPAESAPELSGSFGGVRVRKLLITDSDRLVAATSEGLLIAEIDSTDYRRTRFRTIRRNGDKYSSLCSNATMSLVQNKQGVIFISTESSGVDMINEESLFSDNPEFTHINTATSVLPSDIGKAMAAYGDTLLMIVGQDNIMALNPQTRQCINFSKAFWGENCSFEESSPVRLDNGTWVFGASQGVYMATPHNIYTRGYRPHIVFTTLAVNGGVGDFCLPSRDEITLDADSRNISVCFAAIDFAGNEDILYRTRLDGSPWTTANRMRNVILFNLAPGEHILEVQSTDRYGRWVDNAKSLKINVLPFWHETLWARLFFMLLIVGFVSAVVYTYIYVRRVNSHRREVLAKYMAILREREEWTKTRVEEPKKVVSDMEALEIGQKPEDVAFLDKVRRYIRDNIGNSEANVDDMGEAVAASRSTLNRRLRSLMGVSASQLLNEARMQHAEELLRSDSENQLSVSDVAQACGFSDKYYFQRVFKKKFGVSPSEYRDAAE